MKNRAWNKAGDAYYNQEKQFIFHLIPDGPNVILDCGCGAGGVGKKLLEIGKAREMVGVEIFETAAEEARKHYKRVHVGDIEEMSLDYNEYFDIIICGDLLEHLKEPGGTLNKLRPMLKPNGLIICCLPNFRYWRVWRDVIFKGEFAYAKEGIMDQTHLRFFTTRSFKRLLTECDFQVEYTGMKMAVGPKQEMFNRLTFGKFQEFLGLQMIVSGRKR